MTETEIERMVVRLIGDASSYEKMLKNVAIASNRVVQQVTDAGRKVEALQQKLEKGGIAMASAGRRISLFMSSTFGLVGAMAVKAGADFDSGFAGIRKTVNATEGELKKLREDFKQLATEIPITIDELLKIGEIAGQLGIRDDKIKEFTKVIALLGVTTNLSVEEGAAQLARFANITGMSQNKFSNLASAIVELGNGSKVLGEEFKNLGAGSATTEQDIVNMAMRLAGAGTTIGMTVPQILGMATALSSVGLEAELGGTAMSRLFLEMQTAIATGDESLEVFAATSKKTVEEFRNGFRNNAAVAVQDFISGLKDLSAEERIVAIKSMGVEGIRLTDVLLRAAGATDLFKRTMVSAEQAYEKNTALTKEAAERFRTFWSATTLMRNELKLAGEEAFQNMEEHLRSFVRLVADAAKWFRRLTGEEQGFIIAITAAAAVLGPFLILLGNMIWSLSQVIKVLQMMPSVMGGLKDLGKWMFDLHTSIGNMAWFPMKKGVAEVSTGLIHLKGVAQQLDDIWDSTFWKMNERVLNLTDATRQAKATWKDAFDSFRAWSDHSGPIGPPRPPKLLETRTFTTAGGSGEWQGPMPRHNIEVVKQAERALLEWNGVTMEATRIAGVAQRRIEGLGRAFVIITPPMQRLTHDIFVFEGVTKRLTTTAFVLIDAWDVMTTEMIAVSRAFTIITPPVQNLTHDFFVFEGVTKRLTHTIMTTDMILSSASTRFILLDASIKSATATAAAADVVFKRLGFTVTALATAGGGGGGLSSFSQGVHQASASIKLLPGPVQQAADAVDIIDGEFRRVSLASQLWSAGLSKLQAGVAALMSRLPTLTGMLAATKAMLKFLTLEILLLVGYGIYKATRAIADWAFGVHEFNRELEISIERSKKLAELQAHQRNVRDIRISQIEDPEEKRAALGTAHLNAQRQLEQETKAAEELRDKLHEVNTTWNMIKLYGSASFAGTGTAIIKDMETELEAIKQRAQAAQADVNQLELQMEGIPKGAPTAVDDEANRAAEAAKAAAEDAQKTIQDITDSLVEQYQTWGMTSREVEIWKASMAGAAPEVIAYLEAVDDELTRLENSEALKEMMKDLKKQAATFGMTSDEITLYELKMKGATEEQLKSAKAILDKNKSLADEKKLMEEGKRVAEELLSPLEKFNKEKERLDEMLKRNAINQEVYNKALKAAQEEMNKLKDKDIKIRFGVTGIEAVEAGSAEAMAKIAAFQNANVAVKNLTKSPLTMKQGMGIISNYTNWKGTSGIGGAAVGTTQGATKGFDAAGQEIRAARDAAQSAMWKGIGDTWSNNRTGVTVGDDASQRLFDPEGMGGPEALRWGSERFKQSDKSRLAAQNTANPANVFRESPELKVIVEHLYNLVELTKGMKEKDTINVSAADLGRSR